LELEKEEEDKFAPPLKNNNNNNSPLLIESYSLYAIGIDKTRGFCRNTINY
jgi:hypothetical protein